jgi:hypothetical protein
VASAFTRGHPCPRVLDFVLMARQTSPRATTSDRVTIMLSPLRGDRARDIVARPPFFMRTLPPDHAAWAEADSAVVETQKGLLKDQTLSTQNQPLERRRVPATLSSLDTTSPCGGIGRRAVFRWQFRQRSTGSNPVTGTSTRLSPGYWPGLFIGQMPLILFEACFRQK